MERNYPIYDICNLVTKKVSQDLFNIDRFHGYLKNNPHMQSVHKHTFYHLVYFTKGNGQHILDFETYPIEEGLIYFMRPNQTHQWLFDGEVDGYVINFSSTFFDQLSISSHILDNFPFFNLFSSNQVLTIKGIFRSKVIKLFEAMLKEVESSDDITSPLLIAAHLLQLFVLAERNIDRDYIVYNRSNHNSTLVMKFLELIEEHFRELRLPKDYAAMLHVTSNHLNFVCQEHVNTSAGQLIRKRVLLEAKRLLVNFDLSISTIALNLNFFDPSYFIKFFKKHVGLTPEAFRKQYYNKA